ncbi:MAG: hypothetical protein P8N40_09665 [Gammaproteobacteria bacterium]|nr:hypothetical protein [Gammaproteobacteria bacterium]
MKISRLIVLILFAFVHVQHAFAQDYSQSIREARASLDRFIEKWNSIDDAAVREELSFPHISHGPNGFVVIEQAQDWFVGYDNLRQQGWGSSAFNNITVLQASDDKVNFTVEFSRIRPDGEIYLSGLVYYVWTKQDGEWGMQYRSGDPLFERHDSAEVDFAIAEGMQTIEEFFMTFNSADNPALREVTHIPQIMLNRNFFIHAENTNSPLANVDFNRLREQENWLRSDRIDVQVTYATPTRVFFELAFERYDQNNEKYRTVPALWVLSKRDNRWGVDFRSLMEPSFQR